MTSRRHSCADPLFARNRVFGVTSVGRRITPLQILEAIEEAEWKVEYV